MGSNSETNNNVVATFQTISICPDWNHQSSIRKRDTESLASFSLVIRLSIGKPWVVK